MAPSLPPVPTGSGAHPVIMVALAANDLAASSAFYRQVFQWPVMPMSAELAVAAMPAGPMVTLRANTPPGLPGAIPFVQTPDVAHAIEQASAAGATLERAPWTATMMGTLARITAPGGTIYGLTSAMPPAPQPHWPAPFGDAPRMPAGCLCSLELHASDLGAAASFVQSQFGWGTLPTMPQYCMFDAGAGIGGVFQSHTPTTAGLVYIAVTDVAATLDAIDAAGGKRLGAPMAMPGMATFGYFTDPSGTAMGLLG
jgi:predicted enzyme related to lactoylglutathione lyase